MSDYELELRRGLHIKLLLETHVGLKLQSCKLKLSMQSIMDELASMVVEEDPHIMRRLKDLSLRRREREVRALNASDTDSLLDHIENLGRRRKE